MQTLELPDTIQRRSGLPDNVDLDCLLHLAFALLLKAYVRTNDVAFALLHGAVAEGIETVIEAQLDETATLLENLQNLAKVMHDSAETKQFNTALCLTQSHLSTQLIPTSLDVNLALEIIKDDSNNMDSGGLRAILHFRPDHCNQWGAQNVLATFESILASVAVSLQHPLSKVDTISARDREQITAWNEIVPSPAHRTLNECFEKVFRENADKEAVHTSEGSFTYGQLDDLSTTLALHLVELGVTPNMVVPLCMDKTRWSTCAMTAVWKAGGALTALEPDHPDERLFSIIADLGAKIVICDRAYASRFQELGVQVLSDVEALIATLRRGETTLSRSNVWRMSGVISTDLAFVVFTSGSTGKPKGILNTHNRVTTEHQWYREGLGYHKDARVLQFASYAYVPGTA
jgi:non-ribosomal peptide synthetase component F